MNARNEISLQVDHIVAHLKNIRADMEQAPSAHAVREFDGPRTEAVRDFTSTTQETLQALAARTQALENSVSALVADTSAAVRDLDGVDADAASSAQRLHDNVKPPTASTTRTGPTTNRGAENPSNG